MDFISESGRVVLVEVRRRKGTRHLRLSLGHQNQIVASVPWHSSQRVVSAFLEKQRQWVESQLQRLPEVYTLGQWLDKEPRLTASGDVFTLRIALSTCRKADYVFEQGASVVVLRLPEINELSLRGLVRCFAQDALTCRLAYHAKGLGLAYGALSVRDQSSRWGSCSARRGISLNWRLVLLAPELQDYIILHELAHLTEMNHGKRFWALLDQYDPGRKLHEAALERISPQIMRIAR